MHRFYLKKSGLWLAVGLPIVRIFATAQCAAAIFFVLLFLPLLHQLAPEQMFACWT